MGYILPVTHYQYQDYQTRLIKERNQPFYIDKPYKTILETAHENVQDQERQQMNKNEREDQSFPYKKQDKLTPHDRTQTTVPIHISRGDQDSLVYESTTPDSFAGITGKGVTFNTCI